MFKAKKMSILPAFLMSEKKQVDTETLLTNTVLSGMAASNLFKWFHISGQLLGGDKNLFIFSPRVPMSPARDYFGSVIEDDFTKRISVAPSITDALGALGLAAVKNRKSSLWVYAADLREDPVDDVSVYDLQSRLTQCDKDLSYQENDGTDTYWQYSRATDMSSQYSFHDWEASTGLNSEYDAPSELPAKLKAKWKGCVPDASATGEKWITKPTPLLLLGKLEGGESSALRIRLTNFAVEELLSYHEHLGIALPKSLISTRK